MLIQNFAKEDMYIHHLTLKAMQYADYAVR